jgi:ABC-type transporter Mla subunit MlaD
MALQDLTPQLRTRLSKVERAVGWFVILAALLLVAGFAYYAWNTAQRKGWFTPKARYYTLARSAAGLKVGDPVRMIGFNVGEITMVEAVEPYGFGDVFIAFTIRRPYYGYLWDDSRVRFVSDVIGNRSLEVTKGIEGKPTYEVTNQRPAAVWNRARSNYVALDLRLANDEAERNLIQKGYWLVADESVPFNDRLDQLLTQAEAALPNILALTNRLNDILDEGITAAETANKLLTSAQPVVDNLEKITDQITDPEGSLGEWLLPPDIREQLTNALAAANATLANANGTLTNVDARISALAVELERALENLSSITSNLNAQVAANPNLVKEISDAINHADELVQGLKRHWLLRSAFKNQGSDQPASRPPTSRSPSPARPRAGKPIW